MAYNNKKSKIYLFGGASEKEVVSDLWSFEMNKWVEVPFDDGPEPRTFACLTYDELNERLILFGGNKVLFGKETNKLNLLNDTWQFKNGVWQKITTTNAPIPRAEASIVYDGLRDRIILFGGYTIDKDQYIKLGDTWEFHDNEWNQISEAGPSPRHGAAIAYSQNENCIYLFGGSTVDKQYGDSAGETWKWSNYKWSKIETDQPPGVFNASMIYDLENQSLVRFGGWNGGSRTNNTWVFSDNKWKAISQQNHPEPRNHSNMIYDIDEKRVVLFGGHDGENIFGDTWEYSNGKWNQIIAKGSLKRIENKH